MSTSQPSTPSPLALDIARHIKVSFPHVGWVYPECAPEASDTELAAAVDEVLLPRLAAHAEKLSLAALKGMCLQDDLAEAMALGIELHLEGVYERDHPHLVNPLKAWRTHRPTPGLVGDTP